MADSYITGARLQTTAEEVVWMSGQAVVREGHLLHTGCYAIPSAGWTT